MSAIQQGIAETEGRLTDMAGQLLAVAMQIADVRDPVMLARVLRICEGADLQMTVRASADGTAITVALHLVDRDAGDPLARLFQLQAAREVPPCCPH